MTVMNGMSKSLVRDSTRSLRETTVFSSLLFFVFLSGCVTAADGLPVAGIQDYPWKSIHQKCAAYGKGAYRDASIEAICVNGIIDADLANEFSTLDFGGTRFLVLESEGGIVRYSLQMAELIDQHEFIAVVGGVCVSACAQFLFVSANHKVIVDPGFVGIHGGPISTEKIEQMNVDERTKTSLINENDAFRAFYARKGISMDMLTKPPAEVQKMLDEGQIVFWTWSVEEFESFGVHNITIVQP